MSIRFNTFVFAMAVIVGSFSCQMQSQVVAAEPTGDRVLSGTTENHLHRYMLFYRKADSRMQSMQKIVKKHVDAHENAGSMKSVNVNSQEHQSVVKQFDAKRFSLPTVVCVAPNGAVTGIYSRTVNSDQLSRSIITPKFAEVILALQQGKIAVVSLLPKDGSEPLDSAQKFIASEGFSDRTSHIAVQAADAEEQDFFSRVKVDTNLSESMMILFAPPGRLIGKFTAETSYPQIVEKMHSSGGCNCEKCQKARASN